MNGNQIENANKYFDQLTISVAQHQTHTLNIVAQLMNIISELFQENTVLKDKVKELTPPENIPRKDEINDETSG